MVAARRVRLERITPEHVARQADLDPETLKKWVAYLKPGFRPFLQKWHKAETTSDTAAVRTLAEEYQEGFQVTAKEWAETLQKWSDAVDDAVLLRLRRLRWLIDSVDVCDVDIVDERLVVVDALAVSDRVGVVEGVSVTVTLGVGEGPDVCVGLGVGVGLAVGEGLDVDEHQRIPVRGRSRREAKR
jgi:hypothetical protein